MIAELALAAVMHTRPTALPPRRPADCYAIFHSGASRGNSNHWWLPPSDVGMGGREAWLLYCIDRASKKRGPLS